MDIFCQIREKMVHQIVQETGGFYLIHDGYPLVEGHLLIIPKTHTLCFSRLDPSLRSEFTQLKKDVCSFLRSFYREPVVFEHGIAGQTVLHAHLHIVPTALNIESEISRIANPVETPDGPYLYYEREGRGTYYNPAGQVEPGYLHSVLYARALGRPLHGPDRAKELQGWLLSVKKKWEIWRKR